MILKLVRKFFHGVRPFLSEPGNAGSEWLVLIIAFGLFQCHTRSSFVGWVERSETHRDNCDMRWVSQGLNPTTSSARLIAFSLYAVGNVRIAILSVIGHPQG